MQVTSIIYLLAILFAIISSIGSIYFYSRGQYTPSWVWTLMIISLILFLIAIVLSLVGAFRGRPTNVYPAYVVGPMV